MRLLTWAASGHSLQYSHGGEPVFALHFLGGQRLTVPQQLKRHGQQGGLDVHGKPADMMRVCRWK